MGRSRWTAGVALTRRGVPLAPPYGPALVERTVLGRLQFGRTEEVGDFARHVEDDRPLRGLCTLAVVGGVLGQEVGDGRADRPTADAVLAGEAGDGLAAQVRGRAALVLSAVSAIRRLPLLPLAPAARSRSYVKPRWRSRWSSPAAARLCTMNLMVDRNSPVCG
ncbi:hypothetical protein ACWGLF_29020 [Streptomyces puniciscabiei]